MFLIFIGRWSSACEGTWGHRVSGVRLRPGLKSDSMMPLRPKLGHKLDYPFSVCKMGIMIPVSEECLCGSPI